MRLPPAPRYPPRPPLEPRRRPLPARRSRTPARLGHGGGARGALLLGREAGGEGGLLGALELARCGEVGLVVVPLGLFARRGLVGCTGEGRQQVP